MNKIKFISLTASLALATTLTISCGEHDFFGLEEKSSSSDDGSYLPSSSSCSSENGSSSSSDDGGYLLSSSSCSSENGSSANVEIDAAYEEIIELAKRLSDELEYDWTSREDYDGVTPIQTPGKRLRQCNGYAIEMMENAIKLKSVKSVEHWRATPATGAPGNHSWNIIKLVDGRILYCDLRSFATNRINAETGEIYYAEDYRWNKISFDEKAFRTAPNASYYPHGFLLEEARASGMIAGDGTAGNPYIITTAEQLAAISIWVSAMNPTLKETYSAAHYKLGDNLNLSEYVPMTTIEWKPIGTSTYPFSGVFDGNGKVINGLSINSTSINRGLFGSIRGGTVKNLGLEGVDISGNNQVGGIAGNIESTTISDCYTTGKITASGSNVGGIAGRVVNDDIIENCYSTVVMNGSGTRVGGIVGNLTGMSVIKNSAALNPSIVGAANVERVFGLWIAGSNGTRTNNIAFSNMLNNSGTTDFRNKTLIGCGGADITSEQIIADGTLGGRFVAPAWKTENGKLPGFETARPLPDYISTLTGDNP
jgi:hypothetical protein